MDVPRLEALAAILDFSVDRSKKTSNLSKLALYEENEGSINISDWFQTSRFWNMVFSSRGKSNPLYTRNSTRGFYPNGEISESSDWEEQPRKMPSNKNRRNRKSKNTGMAQNVPDPMRNVYQKETTNSFGGVHNIQYPMRSVDQRQSTFVPSGWFPNGQYTTRSAPPRTETSDSFGSFENFESNSMNNQSLRGEASFSSGSVPNRLYPEINTPQSSQTSNSFGSVPNRLYPEINTPQISQTSNSFGIFEHVEQQPVRSPSPRKKIPAPFGSLGNVENPMENSSLRREISVSPGSLGNVENPMRSFSPNGKPSNSIDLSEIPNVAFYQNKIPAAPNEEYIDEILTNWKGAYAKLQENTTYLQWLFPNKIAGTNSEAHILNDAEAKIIQKTPILKNRVKTAFIMMLDCYGMELTGLNQIQLKENCKNRLKQLNKQDSPKFLSITRILLALKELGHHDLMLPWLKCFATLIYKENKLCHAKYSFENFWTNTLDAEDQIVLDIYKRPFEKRMFSLRKAMKVNGRDKTY